MTTNTSESFNPIAQIIIKLQRFKKYEIHMSNWERWTLKCVLREITCHAHSPFFSCTLHLHLLGIRNCQLPSGDIQLLTISEKMHFLSADMVLLAGENLHPNLGQGIASNQKTHSG